ncbi:helix-turn-helix domain-containing protein [Streptomyces synnematoformans]|uniref:PucR family transcriptional regulator n=1 Tax=Streptomyces synnematoformans TaxID=415721 RepID=UPI0031D63986
MAARRARSDHDWAVLASASRALTDRVPLLADRLLDELAENSPHYDLAVPRDEHWEQICVALRYGIEAIAASRSAPRRDLAYARELGRRRAEQGLPLELLHQAYRQAAYLVWDEMLDVVADDDPGSLPVLLRTATQMWSGVDRQTATLTDAYRATERELQRRTDGRGQALLDALLDAGDGDADPALVQRAAAALDLPEAGRYAVVVLRSEHPGPGVPVEPGGMRFLWRMRTDVELAVVALGAAASPTDLQNALRARCPGPGGISPVVGSLAKLGHARRQAELALSTVGPGGADSIVRLAERLPAALVVSRPELAGLLVAEVFGELLRLEAPDRATLLETLEAWLSCGGSAGRTATRLYCHRNTVFNRLRRLEQLTSRSLSHPRDLIELMLALEAYWRG